MKSENEVTRHLYVVAGDIRLSKPLDDSEVADAEAIVDLSSARGKDSVRMFTSYGNIDDLVKAVPTDFPVVRILKEFLELSGDQDEVLAERQDFNIYSHFADALKDLIQKRPIRTHKELADLLGVATSSVKAYMEGKTLPEPDRFISWKSRIEDNEIWSRVSLAYIMEYLPTASAYSQPLGRWALAARIYAGMLRSEMYSCTGVSWEEVERGSTDSLLYARACKALGTRFTDMKAATGSLPDLISFVRDNTHIPEHSVPHLGFSSKFKDMVREVFDSKAANVVEALKCTPEDVDNYYNGLSVPGDVDTFMGWKDELESRNSWYTRLATEFLLDMQNNIPYGKYNPYTFWAVALQVYLGCKSDYMLSSFGMNWQYATTEPGTKEMFALVFKQIGVSDNLIELCSTPMDVLLQAQKCTRLWLADARRNTAEELLQTSFATYLTDYKNQRKLSDKELAKLLGVSKSSLYDYLNGRSIPKPDRFIMWKEKIDNTIYGPLARLFILEFFKNDTSVTPPFRKWAFIVRICEGLTCRQLTLITSVDWNWLETHDLPETAYNSAASDLGTSVAAITSAADSLISLVTYIKYNTHVPALEINSNSFCDGFTNFVNKYYDGDPVAVGKALGIMLTDIVGYLRGTKVPVIDMFVKWRSKLPDTQYAEIADVFISYKLIRAEVTGISVYGRWARAVRILLGYTCVEMTKVFDIDWSRIEDSTIDSATFGKAVRKFYSDTAVIQQGSSNLVIVDFARQCVTNIRKHDSAESEAARECCNNLGEYIEKHLLNRRCDGNVEQLANILYCTPSVVRSYIAGNAIPKPDTFLRWKAYINADTTYKELARLYCLCELQKDFPKEWGVVNRWAFCVRIIAGLETSEIRDRTGIEWYHIETTTPVENAAVELADLFGFDSTYFDGKYTDEEIMENADKYAFALYQKIRG